MLLDPLWSFFGFLLTAMDPAWSLLEPIFLWHDTAPWGLAISSTVWAFPAIETVHILAMAVMFGGMLVWNLRLFNLGMTRQPLPLLANTLKPFVNWGILIMLVSGYFLFSSEAGKSFANDGFKIKMLFLVAALIFQYTFYNKQIHQDDAHRNPTAGRVAAVGNFLLWFLVGAGGRAIGFV